MDKCCQNCIHFQLPSGELHSLGQCKFPVPEWLEAPASPYISMPEYSGRECATYQSRAGITDTVTTPTGE